MAAAGPSVSACRRWWCRGSGATAPSSKAGECSINAGVFGEVGLVQVLCAVERVIEAVEDRGDDGRGCRQVKFGVELVHRVSDQFVRGLESVDREAL